MKSYRHSQSHRPSRRKLLRRRAAFDAMLREVLKSIVARTVENYMREQMRLALRQPVWLAESRFRDLPPST